MLNNLDVLVDYLKLGECTIVFDKVDGSKRIMKSTLNDSYIDQHTMTTGTASIARTPNENILVVFDTEKNDWRSMRKESITDWYVEVLI